jgi:hypothetical protein
VEKGVGWGGKGVSGEGVEWRSGWRGEGVEGRGRGGVERGWDGMEKGVGVEWRR